MGGVGAVRVTPAVAQPSRVGGGEKNGVLDGREALPAVEQDRDERVPEAVGCIRSTSPSSTPSSPATWARSTNSQLMACWV